MTGGKRHKGLLKGSSSPLHYKLAYSLNFYRLLEYTAHLNGDLFQESQGIEEAQERALRNLGREKV
jgi:hypothetical protein